MFRETRNMPLEGQFIAMHAHDGRLWATTYCWIEKPEGEDDALRIYDPGHDEWVDFAYRDNAEEMMDTARMDQTFFIAN